MQIVGSADQAVVERIERVITEHYDESAGFLISMNVTHVALNEVYLVQIVVGYESDDEFKVHAETVRVDIAHHAREINFTLLNEVELNLTDEVCRYDVNHDSLDHK
jgi:hypothetical protein